MKTKLFLLCFASVLTTYAADPPTQLNSTLRSSIQVSQSERIQALLVHSKTTVSPLTIGRSDIVLSGPLVYGFRRLPHEENLTRFQKILRLPVIRLVVPGPMERPPEGGPKYFAWKSEESSLAWTKAASRPEVVKGPEANPAVRAASEIPQGQLNLQLKKR
jgi:hypothetical protein